MFIRVLGPLSIITADGSDVVITGLRQRKILATLAVQPNRAVSFHRLIDAVWPTNPPATAREQIQNCVGLLRRHLSDADSTVALLSRPNGYLLKVAPEQLDSLTFERLRSDAELLAHSDKAQALRLLRRALGLWQGRPLDGIEHDRLDATRLGLEEMYLNTIMRYSELAQDAEVPQQDLLPDLLSWAAEFPYHEALHARLARCLHGAGRTSEGLDTIRRLRLRLQDELGVDVGQQIEELQRQLLGAHDNAHTARPGGDVTELSELLTQTVERLDAIMRILHGQRIAEPADGRQDAYAGQAYPR